MTRCWAQPQTGHKGEKEECQKGTGTSIHGVSMRRPMKAMPVGVDGQLSDPFSSDMQDSAKLGSHPVLDVQQAALAKIDETTKPPSFRCSRWLACLSLGWRASDMAIALQTAVVTIPGMLYRSRQCMEKSPTCLAQMYRSMTRDNQHAWESICRRTFDSAARIGPEFRCFN